MLSESSPYILLVTIPEDNIYATLHVWGIKSALQILHWSPSISLDVPTTTVIHTMVTNSSRSLMESIKPCKYLQDKKPSRQSIPIYRTMEGSHAAVFQVRKINNVRFGKKRERGGKTTCGGILQSFTQNVIFPSIIPTTMMVPYSSKVQVWHGCVQSPHPSPQQVSRIAGSAYSEVAGDIFWRKRESVDVTGTQKPGR